jgi:hypothetical protein
MEYRAFNTYPRQTLVNIYFILVANNSASTPKSFRYPQGFVKTNHTNHDTPPLSSRQPPILSRPHHGRRPIRRPSTPQPRFAPSPIIHTLIFQNSRTNPNKLSVRAEVSVAPLAWNDNLAAWALQYANELASLDRGMNHCKQLRDIKQGENLSICSGPWTNPLLESSKLWYAEKKDWPGGVIQAQGVEKWGHYTQVRHCCCGYGVELMLILLE